ncbi:CDP-alcohol phosphatidyltransferase family protein [Trinickia sp. NRRL B-1857]|uniref:CDP-alcohol phosphatidyltransferase family protein n=1 Tax=Trinickia sp. NRRL B-1857 TaxID=3162879 RepID=UPI003D29E21C
MNIRATATARAYAWGIHVLTASGVIFGLMAILAVEDRNWHGAMLWLFIALIVDGIDGPIARKINVQSALPRFDGGTLDLLVDYFTFVIVPALLLYHSALLPATVRFAAAATILMSALHHYCNRDIKTEDGYFVGFPAFWNVAVFYFYRFPQTPSITAATVFLLCALTLAPIKVVHPIRVKKFRALNVAVALLWLAFAGIALALPDLNESWLLLGNILPLTYFAWISIRRTVAGPDWRGIETSAEHAGTKHGV